MEEEYQAVLPRVLTVEPPFEEPAFEDTVFDTGIEPDASMPPGAMCGCA